MYIYADAWWALWGIFGLKKSEMLQNIRFALIIAHFFTHRNTFPIPFRLDVE